MPLVLQSLGKVKPPPLGLSEDILLSAEHLESSELQLTGKSWPE